MAHLPDGQQQLVIPYFAATGSIVVATCCFAAQKMSEEVGALFVRKSPEDAFLSLATNFIKVIKPCTALRSTRFFTMIKLNFDFTWIRSVGANQANGYDVGGLTFAVVINN